MRLIDADKLRTILTDEECPCALQTALIGIIDAQPTAYDVDKVVEELRQRSKEYNSGVRLHGKPEEMLTEEAIEIVKAGATNES